MGSKYEGILEVDYAYQDKNDLPSGFDWSKRTRNAPWGISMQFSSSGIPKFGPFAVINADDYYGGSATFLEIDPYF